MRTRLRAAIRKACNARGDSEEHYAKCVEEVFEEPREQWSRWLEYFEDVAQIARGQNGVTT